MPRLEAIPHCKHYSSEDIILSTAQKGGPAASRHGRAASANEQDGTMMSRPCGEWGKPGGWDADDNRQRRERERKYNS